MKDAPATAVLRNILQIISDNIGNLKFAQDGLRQVFVNTSRESNDFKWCKKIKKINVGAKPLENFVLELIEVAVSSLRDSEIRFEDTEWRLMVILLKTQAIACLEPGKIQSLFSSQADRQNADWGEWCYIFPSLSGA